MVDVESQDRFITDREAADLAGFSYCAWRKRRLRKKPGPPFVRLSPRTVRYRLSDVIAWMSDLPAVVEASPPTVVDDAVRKALTSTGALAFNSTKKKVGRPRRV